MNEFFGFLNESMQSQVDFEDFLSWLYQASQSEIDVAEIPGMDENVAKAIRQALDMGVAPLTVSELEKAVEQILTPPPAPAKPKPWERVARPEAKAQQPPAQVDTDDRGTKKTAPKAAATTSDFGSEDMRDLGDDDLREEIVEVFDAGHKRHHLPFKLSSEESKEQVTRMMARVRSTEEPVTQAILAKWVDARFARIAESRTAGDRVRKDLGSQRVGEGLFGALCGLIREGSYNSAMAGYAVRMAQEGLKDEDSVAVLQRTAALGGTDGAFQRAYRRVVGDTPPARQAVSETSDEGEPAMARAFGGRRGRDRQPEPTAPRKKAPWARG